MQSILHILLDKFQCAIATAFPQITQEVVEASVDVVLSTNEKFGHYQCNSAMKLAKELQKNPRQIAQIIVQHLKTILEDEQPMISRLEIAGAGFINIALDPSYLAGRLKEVLCDPLLGIARPSKQHRIIIDFSSPNIAKEMHVGHLRSTIIGDSLARLFEFLGEDVLRLNHIGDWGTAFGMLIAHMKELAPEVLNGEEKTDLTHLVSWYKTSKQRFDNEPAFKRASQQEVIALQRGDPESLRAWGIICRVSEIAYQEIYDLLGVKLISRGESFYNPLLADIVADLESKGLVTISGGAKCIFLEGYQNREGEPLPLMIQKSDGGYNYDTTDMAAIRYRIAVEKADRLIYVTDAGQSQHFEMIFKAAEKAGYLDRTKVQVDHVPFGLVLGPDGKKFRTRSGETERLIDLLTNAITHADAIIAEKMPGMDRTERDVLASVLGISAVKYADLSCNRTGDYAFSYERMLKFEGNTAAFLMYACVRVAGIKRKIGADIEAVKCAHAIHLAHPSEIALAMQIVQFGEALEQVARELLPNRLTDYLYQLAEKFNAFFRDCRVEGSAEQESRLLLCEATARTLKQGLEILGVKTVERM